MSAAILQGVIVTTIDTDIWVDLPERQYIRLMNLVLQQGGTVKATIERQPVKVLPLERILKSKKMCYGIRTAFTSCKSNEF